MDSMTPMFSTRQWVEEQRVQAAEVEAYGPDLSSIPSTSQWPAAISGPAPGMEETAQTDDHCMPGVPFSSNNYPEHPPKRQHLEEGKYRCDLCGTSYTEQRSLLRHQRTPAHSQRSGQPSRFYPCQHCDKQFPRVDLRQRHENEVHCGLKRRRKQRVVRRPRPLTQETEMNQALNPEPNAEDGSARRNDSTEWTANLNDILTTAREAYPWGDDAVLDEAPLSALDFTSSEFLVPMDADENPPIPTTTTMDLTQEESPREPLVFSSTLQGPQRSQSLQSTHAAPEQDETASTCSFPTSTWSVSLPLRGPSLTRRVSSLRRGGANLRPHSVKPPPPCPLCRTTIGRTVSEMKEHFSWHFAETRGTHVCRECRVKFLREQDLVAHQISARKGHCGLHFPHNQPCCGHHPPKKGEFICPDHKRMQRSYLTWEKAQIDAFWVYLHEVSQMDIFRTEHQCWSVDEFWNQSRSSLNSAVSRRSAPAHVNFHGKVKVSDIKAAKFHREQADISLTKDQSSGNSRNSTIGQGGRRSVNTRLVQAIRNRAYRDVQSLIWKGARVNATIGPIEYEDGEIVERTKPLVVAARRADSPIFDLLLAKGANLEESVGSLQREVTQAIADSNMTNFKATDSAFSNRSKAYISAFGMLIEAGAQLDDHWNSMLLGLAVDIQAVDSVNLLLSLGVRANCSVTPFSGRHDSVETRQITVLSLAVERANLRIFVLLQGYQPKDANKALLTALATEKMNAMGYPYPKATIHPVPFSTAQRERVLNFALSAAVQQTDSELLSYLLNIHGRASANARRAEDGESLLIAALEAGATTNANILISYGAEPNPRRSTQGESALMLALQLGNAQLVNKIARVANVRSPDQSGQTPLDRAVQLGRGDFVRTLLQYDADPDIQSAGKEHPLVEAAKKGDVKIVRALIKHHEERLGGLRPRLAHPKSRSRLYASAASAAVTHDRLVVLDELLRSGCSADFPVEDRASALIYATEKQMPEITAILLSHGAQIAA